jgi:hypothetical protein
VTTDDEALVARVIEHLLARDLDTVMQHYGEQSVLRVVGVDDHAGATAIRDYFVAALAGAPPGADFVRQIDTEADGRVVMRWRLLDRPGGSPVASGEDRYRIDRRTIVDQVVSHHPSSSYDSAT